VSATATTQRNALLERDDLSSWDVAYLYTWHNSRPISLRIAWKW